MWKMRCAKSEWGDVLQGMWRIFECIFPSACRYNSGASSVSVKRVKKGNFNCIWLLDGLSFDRVHRMLFGKNMKYESTPARTGYLDSSGNIVWSDKVAGYWGGGDVLTEDGKTVMTVGGVFFLAVGCGFLCYTILFGIASHRCWLKVYSDHVESYAGLMNDYVHCAHTQIQSVQMYKSGVVLTTGGTKRKIMCKEPQKAFDIIKQCHMNALHEKL